jgi:hypothetical protein
MTLITVYGVVALSFMLLMYALERRHPGFVAAFAGGCLASSAYGFLAGAWPFGVVELVWFAVATARYTRLRRSRPSLVAHPPGGPEP